MTVQVADGNGGFDTQAIAVTVTNVNEAPVITSDGGGASANLSVAENQTAVTTVTSTDVDGGAPSYSIVGGADAALFTIDSATGAIDLRHRAGLRIAGRCRRQRHLQRDGAGRRRQRRLRHAGDGGYASTNVNEAPVITSNGGGASAASMPPRTRALSAR